MQDTDPDDAFSKIPYEKGSLFLRYLESKVGGLDAMLRWLKTYFNDFRFKSLTVGMFPYSISFIIPYITICWNVVDGLQLI